MGQNQLINQHRFVYGGLNIIVLNNSEIKILLSVLHQAPFFQLGESIIDSTPI